ncbi:MAG TPA: hypothetical protein VNU68_33835 [Verrucomicrobiae bacterium]|nr:hypothetical protein [Verrucomicrobiae bacterium]
MIPRTQSFTVLLFGATLRFAVAQQLVVVAESPQFTVDTRLPSGASATALPVTTESPAFMLDSRLAGSSPTLAALVRAESAAFALDTRLAGALDDLIVHTVSPVFTLNTIWVGIRKTSRLTSSPVELYWPTNAPGFRLQLADPLLGPPTFWMNMTNTVNESGGFYRTLLPPEGIEGYFRLKL